MTSSAKLIAFDDDRDEAILEFSDGKIFACPTDYITVPQVMGKISRGRYMNENTSNSYTFAIQARCMRQLLKDE